jgi:hypothetical protein
MCKQPVLDGEIHFDHIIPWSKGGPTEEHNIRLLCNACNRKRGASFEQEYLIDSLGDHLIGTVGASFVRMMWKFVADAQEWRRSRQRLPNGSDVARIMGLRRKTKFEDKLAGIFGELNELFSAQRPEELDSKTFGALADRWGFTPECTARKLSKVARTHSLPLDQLVAADMDVIRRLGWPVDRNEREAWART